VDHWTRHLLAMRRIPVLLTGQGDVWLWKMRWCWQSASPKKHQSRLRLLYESLRRTRTRHIQQRSMLMGQIGQWENQLVVKGRRVVTNLLPARIFERNLRRLYSYNI
jgi:hypothetical protein